MKIAMPTRRGLFALSALAFAAALSAPAFAAPATTSHVYTMTNAAAGNVVQVYVRGEHGTLALAQQLSAGGAGTGANLGSQGSVTLSRDGAWLFAVNAGSGTVSTFAVGKRLTLVSTVSAGGATPISVTEANGIVYVLDAGPGNALAGFRNEGGTLVPLANGVQSLGADDVGVAEVRFDRNGQVLAVTEKNTNLVVTYGANWDGSLSAPVANASAGVTPFGFVFDTAGHLLVSEAATSSLSSYKIVTTPDVHAEVISAAVPTGQQAACWAAVTPDGRFAFTANAASPSLSTFDLKHGVLTLASDVAEPAGAHPTDMVITEDDKQLFVLNTGNGTISSFAIDHQGALTPLSTTSGLPLSANGLALN